MNKLDYIFSPACIRDGARTIFEETRVGNTYFRYHEEKLPKTVDFVMETIRENYPDMRIPFHSRWGHFRAGYVDRSLWLQARIRDYDPIEQVRVKWDLVIPSVLLDAGAGHHWSYREKETSREYSRSEGLGIASFHLFLSQVLSRDGKTLETHSDGLLRVTSSILGEYFQVSPLNPLVGIEGRTQLLNNLGIVLKNKAIFKDGRPGNLIDYLLEQNGSMTLSAKDILRAVLLGFGPIWPGRETLDGVNLGDVWMHSRYGLIAFHKLSQWMTYSLIEPLLEAGFNVTGIEELTGLPEYRNGGLLLDSGVLSFIDEKNANETWGPESDLVIEWRALTVFLLDRIGAEVRLRLGKSPSEFPLAKVLEGGTWWAGRKMALSLRVGGIPPLHIISDGTVF